MTFIQFEDAFKNKKKINTKRAIHVLASVLKVVFPYHVRTLTRKQGVIMKLTLKHKNFVIILEEPSERLMIIFIGLIFGLHNVFSYV